MYILNDLTNVMCRACAKIFVSCEELTKQQAPSTFLVDVTQDYRGFIEPVSFCFCFFPSSFYYVAVAATTKNHRHTIEYIVSII